MHTYLKKCLALLVVATATGVLWTSSVSATDYYVRPAGGDYGLEDGTSYANAYDGFSDIVWATVDTGDGKLFVAGTHYEMLLQPTVSGESGYPIYIASCTVANGASINDPGIINGADVVGSWTDDGGSPHTYSKAAVAVMPMQVWENGIRMTYKAVIDGVGQWTSTVATPCTVTISPTDGTLDTEVIEVGQRGCAIYVRDKSWFTIDGLTIKKTAARGMVGEANPFQDAYDDYMSIAITFADYPLGNAVPSDHITVKNCTISEGGGRSYYDGIGGGNSDWAAGIEFFNADDINVINNSIDDVWGVGISFENEATFVETAVNIYNNRVTQCGYNGIGLLNSGANIYRNYVADCGNDSTNTDGLAGIVVAGATNINANLYQNYLYDVGTKGLYIYGVTGGVGNIYYNVVNGYKATEFGGGIVVYGAATNGTIYNNTVYDVTTGTNDRGGIVIEDGCTGWTVKNNIVYTSNYCFWWNADAGAGDPTLSNNLWFRNAAGDAFRWNDTADYVTYANYATFATLSGETGGVVLDPLFHTNGSNYHLQSTSPAISVGTNVSLTTDFDAVPVPTGAGIEIGAFEYIDWALRGATLNGALLP